MPDFFQTDFFVGCEERNCFFNSKQHMRKTAHQKNALTE